MEKQLQPKLRFPEFSYDILSKNAGDLFINHSNKKHNGNLEILAITQDKGAIPRSLINYEVQVSDESVSNYKVVEKGDFIISLRSFQGGIEYSNYDGICSPAYIILKSQTTIVDDYYKFYLKTYNYIIQLRRTLEGIRDGKMIPFKYFSDTILINPELPEQQKIADYLSTIDEKLSLLEEKKTELSCYKKAMMQKLFSQEIRFKDGNGNDFSDWEEKRFSDLYEFKSTNSFSRDKLNYEIPNVKNIHYGDVHVRFKSLFNINNEKVPFINLDINISKISEDNYVRVGDVIIADASENYEDIGKCIEVVNINNEKIVSGLHTFLARKKTDLNYISFMTYLFKTEEYRKQVYKIAQGTKVLSLSINRVMNLKFMLPSLPEQQKIANFLSEIDESIDKVSEQIKETQSFKKAMLQQMFV